MGGACSTCVERGSAYRVLMGKPEGKRPLGRPRLRWEVNIKVGYSGSDMRGRDWISLAQDRGGWQAFVNTVMNLWVP